MSRFVQGILLLSHFVPGRVMQRRRAMITLFAAMLIVCGPAFSQSTFSGDIAGTVTDPGGAVVPNADIEAKQDSTGATVTVKSGSAGAFRVPALNPGMYTL